MLKVNTEGPTPLWLIPLDYTHKINNNANVQARNQTFFTLGKTKSFSFEVKQHQNKAFNTNSHSIDPRVNSV